MTAIPKHLRYAGLIYASPNRLNSGMRNRRSTSMINNSGFWVFNYLYPKSYGNRTSLITVTNTISITGNASYFVDGNSGKNLYFNGTATSGKYLRFDFLTPVVINEATLSAQAGSHGVWQWQGSDDATNWTNIGANFTLSTSPQTQLNSNVSFYRYYQLLGISGNTNGTPWVYEMLFQIGDWRTNIPIPDYGNNGGTGNRTSQITITYNGVNIEDRSFSYIIDGSFANTFWFYPNSSVNSSCYIRFDFGTSRIINEAKWYQDSSTTHGVWQWQASNDATNWTNIGSNFTLGGTTQIQTELSGNTTGYRYYRLLGVSGTTSNAPYIREIEFKIENPIYE